MSSKKKLLAGCILLVLSQAGWAAAEQAYKDPYEGYNRVMFNINDHLDRYIMTPVARGYRKVTPSPVRTGVNNFFNNLRDVVSFGSNLLRLDIEKASTDFVRVGINTTFGLGGLFDIADLGQIPNNKNTLGDTFASWGWKNSNYFVYPLLGPSTVRDSIGSTITNVFPVENAIFKDDPVRWSLTGLNGVASREALLDVTDSLNDAALDPADDEDDDDIDNLVAPGSEATATPPAASVSSNKSTANTTDSDDRVPATAASETDKQTDSTTIFVPVSASQPYWNVH